jgi:hypothetical protein
MCRRPHYGSILNFAPDHAIKQKSNSIYIIYMLLCMCLLDILRFGPCSQGVSTCNLPTEVTPLAQCKDRITCILVKFLIFIYFIFAIAVPSLHCVRQNKT